jgi:hypothetical protein
VPVAAEGRDSTFELIKRTHTTGHFPPVGAAAQFPS